MPRSNKVLKERLARYRQIQLSVTGRKSGKTISIPVWFVAEGDTLFLLPVAGSDTQWYKNVLHDPRIRISARDEEGEFRAKYGAEDVKKYYSKFDVAVRVEV